MPRTTGTTPDEPDDDNEPEKKRRPQGDGGLHWDKSRRRWIATVTVGYTPQGKRIVRKGSGRTKTAAKQALRKVLRDHEDGLPSEPTNYTVAEAVEYWLKHGLSGRSDRTVEMNQTFAENHVIPALGARKLRELSAEDVDEWLAAKSKTLSTRSLKLIHSILNRSVRKAMARDKVRRNIVELCDVPEGREGRPSKALTLAQAKAVLNAARKSEPRIAAYIVLSLATGARTEELRALTWDHVVGYAKDADRWIPVQEAGWEHGAYAIYVWRSVRKKGDTKTRKSRRTLKLPQICVEALRRLQEHQDETTDDASSKRGGLVFCTRTGNPLSASNVRRDFRKVLDKAELDGARWAPREMRHSFVSVLSDHGIPIEDISRLVGHRSTTVTETVYRLQIRPVMEKGATAMDGIFAAAGDADDATDQDP
ncbi:tyrosine-type recombinase/integrase [Actinomadura chibensis]|uniref:Site-specific integrase n=1 Tax=Actinomadura chibensis TaxID=392828 RepID=A0A5D0N224_9ACTN|nr:site-specific integrase [Actinomadura chibensis]TYB38402.1 site-specific integrase [Actinomadura chibensis]